MATTEQQTEIKEREVQIVAINVEIEVLKDKRFTLFKVIRDITGPCPHCHNWHYPFCGEEMLIDQ